MENIKKPKLKKQGFGRLNKYKAVTNIYSFAKIAEITAYPTVSWAERVDTSVLNGSLKLNFVDYGGK